MKQPSFIKTTIGFLWVICSLISSQTSNAQISVNNLTSLSNSQFSAAIADSIKGENIVISNPVFKGVRSSSSGYQACSFTTASTTLTQMGFAKGIALTTGNTNLLSIPLGTDPKSSTAFSTGYNACVSGEIRKGGVCPANIKDLEILVGPVNYYNAAILEFDFIPMFDSINLRYIFGGEEYADNSNFINYQCSTYNDKFGFLINGLGILGGAGYDNDAKNLARLANGSEVGINSVNNGVVGSSGGASKASNCVAANPSWTENTPSPEFLGTIAGTAPNGNTKVLTAAQGGLTPGATYHMKFLIADVFDAAYDAIVYIEGKSFNSYPTKKVVAITPSKSVICAGDSTTLIAKIYNCQPNYSYTWSDGTTTIATTNNSTSLTNTVVVAPTVTTTYTVIAIDINNQTPTTATSSIVITVNNTHPTASISNNGPKCSGSSLSLNSSGGVSYKWSGPNNFSSSDGYIIIPNVITNAAGVYTVTVTGSNTCASTAQTTVVINPSPIADAGFDKTIDCLQNSTGQVEIGAFSLSENTYLWSPTSTLSSATISNPIASPTVTSTYTITVTNTANGCSATDKMFITVNKSVPTANAGAGGSINCSQNTSGIIIGTTNIGGTTYAWSPTTGLSSSTVSNPTANPTVTSTYLLIATNTLSGCTSTNEVVITVDTLRPIVRAGDDQTICSSSSAILSGFIGGTASSATWSGGSGTFSPSVNDLNATYTPSGNETTAGTVTLTLTTDDPDGIGSCLAVADQLTIKINPAATVNAGTDKTICTGTMMSLQGTKGGEATSITWTGGSGTFSPNANSLNAYYIPSSGEITAGSFTLTITTNDPSGPCNAVSDQVTIGISSPPTVNISADQTICKGDSAILSASGGNSYSWSATPIGFTSNLDKPTVYPIVNTTYTVAISNTQGCTNSGKVNITVNDCNNLGQKDTVAHDTTGIKIDNVITVSIDTCVFNYNAPLDSFKITGYSIVQDKILLHVAFYQNPNVINISATIPLTAVKEGNNFVYLTIQCTKNKRLRSIYKTAFITNFTYLGTTEIKKFAESKIQIFPNPTSGALTIVLPSNMKTGATLELYTIDSKKLLMQKANQQTNTIDMSSYPVGVYMLKVISEEGTMNERVVKI